MTNHFCCHLFEINNQQSIIRTWRSTLLDPAILLFVENNRQVLGLRKRHSFKNQIVWWNWLWNHFLQDFHQQIVPEELIYWSFEWRGEESLNCIKCGWPSTSQRGRNNRYFQGFCCIFLFLQHTLATATWALSTYKFGPALGLLAADCFEAR